MEKSLTAQNHPEGKTILAWIHSHVGGNKCDFLSSIDIHNHRTLEKTFGKMQSIVVEILNSKGKSKVYNLTEMGRRRVDKCREKSLNFHNSCARKDFYEEVKPTFSSEISFETFDFSIIYGEKVITLDEKGFLILESDEEINPEDDKEEDKGVSSEEVSSEESDEEISEHDGEEENGVTFEKVSSEGVNSEEDNSEEDMELDVEKSENEQKVDENEVISSGEDIDDAENSDHENVISKDDVDISSGKELNSKSQKMKSEGKDRVDCKYCSKSFVNILGHLRKNNSCMEKYDENNEFDALEKSCKTKSKLLKNKRQVKEYQEDEEFRGKKKEQQKQKYNEDEEFRGRKNEQDKKRNFKKYNEDEEFRGKEKQRGSKRYKEDEEFRGKKKAKCKAKYHEKQFKLSNDDIALRKTFLNKQKNGPSYICVCCHTRRFRNGVQKVEEDFIVSLQDRNIENYITLQERFKYDENHWICHNCHKDLKKGIMPYICHANGLYNSEVPEELKDLTTVEKISIQMCLPFIKVRELPTSRMLVMNSKIANVAISDNDILKTALKLPRMPNELGTVNVAVKRRLKDPKCYKPPELIRPSKINAALAILQDRHVSYKKFPIHILDPSSKYKFIRLPLIGENDVDEKSLSLDDAFESIVPPTLDELGLKLSKTTPRDQNCFINALLDQFTYDDEYKNSNLTSNDVREVVCATVYDKENEDLHPVLYFEKNELISPEDWEEVMSISGQDCLYCDLPFIQMASNYFKRNIVLIPIHQKDQIEDTNLIEKNTDEKSYITVYANDNNGQTLFMLYFPDGEFGPFSHFQSVLKISPKDNLEVPHNYSEDVLIYKLSKINECDDTDEDDEEDNNMFSTNQKTRSDESSTTKRKKGNAYNQVTMLTPEDPASRVVMNETGKKIKKKLKRGGKTYEIAPGEGKVYSDL